MTMWNWMKPATLIDMQRKAALGYMGEQARALQREGYAAEADRVLDEMIERRKSWQRESDGQANAASRTVGR